MSGEDERGDRLDGRPNMSGEARNSGARGGEADGQVEPGRMATLICTSCASVAHGCGVVLVSMV